MNAEPTTTPTAPSFVEEALAANKPTEVIYPLSRGAVRMIALLGGAASCFYQVPATEHKEANGTYIQRHVQYGRRVADARSQDPAKCHTYIVRRDGSLLNITKQIKRWEREAGELPSNAELVANQEVVA